MGPPSQQGFASAAQSHLQVARGPNQRRSALGIDWGRFKVIVWIVVQHAVQLQKFPNHAAHHNKGVAITNSKAMHTHLNIG